MEGKGRKGEGRNTNMERYVRNREGRDIIKREGRDTWERKG